MTTTTTPRIHDLPADLEAPAAAGPTRVYERSHCVRGEDLTLGAWLDLPGQYGAGQILNLDLEQPTRIHRVVYTRPSSGERSTVIINPTEFYTIVDPDSVVEIDPYADPNAGTYPSLDGFDDIDGVKVAYIGEDGNMIVLGHPGRLRALRAAYTVLARDRGEEDAGCDLRRADVIYGWARMITRCGSFPACDQMACIECLSASKPFEHPDCQYDRCVDCSDIQAHSWCLDYGPYPMKDDAAFPVVIVYA